ncbi:MAG: hypothetical protein LC118_19720 [Dehalococcoidia bacterium]|nr:hypothetical protein [Dehalococcoidia bacterium]
MTARAATSRSQDAAGLFAAAAAWLAAAAVIELIILRSFTRTAIHIPGMEEMATPYRVLTLAGRFDYYVAAVLVGGCLPLAALALGGRCGRAGLVAAAGVGLFAMTAFATRAGILGDLLPPALVTVSLGLIVLALTFIDRRTGLAMGVYLAAFALASADAVGQAAAQAGFPQLDGRSLLWASEVVAVAATVCIFFAFRAGRERRSSQLGIVVAVVTAVVLIGGASTAKILLLWNQGMTGTLPAIVYAVAVGLITATVSGLVRERRWLAASALVLVVLGGLGLHSTYQSGLAVIGLAAMMLSANARQEEPAQTTI